MVLVALLAALAVGFAFARRPLRVGAAFASHLLCSGVFVSGLEPGRVFDDVVAPDPNYRGALWALSYEVDRERREVRTRLFGVGSRAVFREGRGCTVANYERPLEARPPEPAAAPPLLPELAGPTEVPPSTEALRGAFQRAFEPGLRTSALVVVHRGKLVAERYGQGVGVDTPLLGWSLAKSVNSALLGVLVGQGRLSADAPVPLPAWSGAADPRRPITVDQLLRHTSGLTEDERQGGLEPTPRMLFLEPDAAGYAQALPPVAPPGTRCAYSSVNTILLGRVLRERAGGDALAFARRALFEPLGMRGVTLELDATGTPLLSTFMYAPARDWARFAMLYLDDGVVGGRRILPQGWVERSRARTPGAPWGSGFWLGTPEWRARWTLPDDLFFGAGMLGQRLVIVPSEQLVVVRLGATRGSGFDTDGLGQLIADVRAALAQEER